MRGASNLIINWRARCRKKSRGHGQHIMSNNSKTNAQSKANEKKADMKVSQKKDQKPSIADVQKVLDEQIEKFQQKAKLIRHRKTFIDTKEELLHFKSEQGSDYDENLDSKILRIALQANSDYRDDTHLKIANNMIVREFIDFAISKIDKKLLELEKEIIG